MTFATQLNGATHLTPLEWGVFAAIGLFLAIGSYRGRKVQ